MRILFRKSYLPEIGLFTDKAQAGWYFAFLALAATAPLFLDGYYLDELSLVWIYAIAGIGLMVLTGFSGQVSFGQSAFVALGAYAHTIFYTKFGFPWPLALLCGAILAGLFGLVVGRACSRMHGLYLAVATLAFALIVERLLGGLELTGRHGGLPVKGISLFGLTASESWQTYLVNLSIFVGVVLLVANLMRSRSGRAMIAIRDSQVSARSLGVNVSFFRAYAFFLAASFAGLAGGLLAHALYYITPETFGLNESIKLLLMIVIGGLGTIHGAVIGAFFIILLPTVLSFVKGWLPTAIGASSGFESLAFGLILIGAILYEPEGIYGRWLKIKHYFDVFPMARKNSFVRQKSFLKTERLK